MEKEFLYPTYIHQKMLYKGLYVNEWILEVSTVVLLTLIFRLPGILIACFACPLYYLLMKRSTEKRINNWNVALHTIAYCNQPRTMVAEPRPEEIKLPEKKRKLRKQKWSKRKKKMIQELYPFKQINHSMIEMENGDLYLFFKIRANNMDMLSQADILAAQEIFYRELDRSRNIPMFFIQDAVFSLDKNILIFTKLKASTEHSFIRKMCESYEEYLETKRSEATKKSFYMRFILEHDQLEKNIDVEAFKGKIFTAFKDSLDLVEVDREELKQMLAIFGNRIFSEQLPDTELEFVEEEEELLLKKKKRSYEYEQLPGIYNFKDLIVPMTCKWNSDRMQMGKNFHKIYAVKSFLGSTKELNLLSEISTLKGVTTTIYLEELLTKEYKRALKLDLKAKNSTGGDELDQIDLNEEKNVSKGSYHRLRRSKQNLYYLSVYFMLSAPTEKLLEELEDQFLLAIDNVDITLDPLTAYQKEGFQCVNPLGSNLLGKWVKQNIPSESVANLYPFSESSLLDPTGLPIGTIYNKQDVLLFDPFISRGNKNILVLGHSGIGKSVLIMKVLENEVYQGSMIRNIDIEGTYGLFFKKLGGLNIDVTGNNEYHINPLQIRTPDVVKNGIVSDFISEVRKWISIYKNSWTEDTLDLFERYLTRTYNKKGFTNNLSSLAGFTNTDYPLLGDVYQEIEDELKQNEENRFLSESMKESLEKMLLGLESAVKGSDAKLFNQYTYLGNIENLQMINFDMRDLMDSSLNRKLAQWSNVFSYISQAVNRNMDQSQRIVVSIDELHEFLKREYLPLVDIINSYERRFRKQNACLLTGTQTLDEVDVKDDVMAPKVNPLLSQPTYKFLFNLGDINYDIPQKLLNLKDIEIKKLKEKRKGVCLLKINKNTYYVNVDMPAWYETVKADA